VCDVMSSHDYRRRICASDDAAQVQEVERIVYKEIEVPVERVVERVVHVPSRPTPGVDQMPPIKARILEIVPNT